MLTYQEAGQLAFNAVAEALKPMVPAEVTAEPTTDSTGADALLVTIVFPDDYESKLREDGTSAVLLGVHQALEDAGEKRWPIFAFATVSDLVDYGDS